jgi:hypothetical protein
MAKAGATYWISDLRQRFSLLSPWERRAFIAASYSLGDEGKYWRQHERQNFGPFEVLIRDWASEKRQSPGWGVPI